MKTLLCLCAITVLATLASPAAINGANRSNLNVGYIYPGDRLLHRGYLYRQGIANTIQYQDLTYRGNLTTRVSAVQATEIGYTQYGSAWIIQGGIGGNNVSVRVQSARGYGYYYVIDIWGR